MIIYKSLCHSLLRTRACARAWQASLGCALRSVFGELYPPLMRPDDRSETGNPGNLGARRNKTVPLRA